MDVVEGFLLRGKDINSSHCDVEPIDFFLHFIHHVRY